MRARIVLRTEEGECLGMRLQRPGEPGDEAIGNTQHLYTYTQHARERFVTSQNGLCMRVTKHLNYDNQIEVVIQTGG